MNGGLPKYRIIKEYLIEKIENGELKENDRIPSERELMERFNVSRITVRKALEELSMEGYIYKVQGVGAFVRKIKTLSFTNKLIGVLVSPVSDYLSVGILRGIENYLTHYGFHPVVQFSNESNQDESEKLHRLVEMGVEGFIIMPHETILENDEIRMLLQEKKPVVFVDRTVNGLRSNSVQSENRKGAFELISHLIKEHQARNILFIAWEGMNISSVRNRYLGALDAARKYNASVEFLITNKKELSTLTKRLLEYDSIFASTDLIAAEILANLEVEGCKVPEKIKVVGFDDRPFARYIHPPLTTVKQFPEKMGEKAASILISIMKNKEIKIQDYYVPVKLILRKSCGCVGKS